jgi:hypothetical protein
LRSVQDLLDFVLHVVQAMQLVRALCELPS